MSDQTQKQDLVIIRIFDAPLEQVWQTWTETDYVMQWWGPAGFTCPLAQMDVREGGTSLLCMRAPQEFGGQDMFSIWQYTAVAPMQQLDFIHNLADKDGHKVDPAALGMPPDFPEDQRQTVTFKALDENRTELTVIEYGWTAGQMMEMSEMGMNQCLDKMEAVLKEGVR